jgi:hypothetical protein
VAHLCRGNAYDREHAHCDIRRVDDLQGRAGGINALRRIGDIFKLTHYPLPRQVVRAADRALRSRPTMTATLQREHWNGQPTYLGDLFRVSKTRGDKMLGAVCKLWTHALGWELRLEINDDLQRSEVFRSQDDVLAVGEMWKAAMIEKGWAY